MFLGTFDIPGGMLTGGVIESAFYDFGDSDHVANIEITGLHFSFGLDLLGAVRDDNFENLLRSLLTNADQVTGTKFADTIEAYGGADSIVAGKGADFLIGDAGADSLFGQQGNDTLRGGADNDILIGGAGRDSLRGNTGADTFRFDRISDSPTGGAVQPDVIEDFSRAQGDKIDLSRIDANTFVAGNQAFEFIGTALFTGNASDAAHRGEVRFVDVGSDVTLLGDVNGDSVADFAITVASVNILKAEDFLL